ALENARRIDAIVLDKTGTLTRGKPAVTQVLASDGLSEDELLRLAAAAEVNSEHPLAQAIVERATELHLAQSLPRAEHFQAVAGQGVQATIDGRELLLGNRSLMQSYGVHLDGLVESADHLAA